MELKELRERIDRIDARIVEAYTERMETVFLISELKKERGLPIYDPDREKVLLDKVAQQAGPRYAEDVQQIFRLLLRLSKDSQDRKRHAGS